MRRAAVLILVVMSLTAGCSRLAGQTPAPTAAFGIISASLTGQEDGTQLNLELARASAAQLTVSGAGELSLGSAAVTPEGKVSVPLPPFSSFYAGQGALTLHLRFVPHGLKAVIVEKNVTFYAARPSAVGVARAASDAGVAITFQARNAGDLPTLVKAAFILVDNDTYPATVTNGTLFNERAVTVTISARGVGASVGAHNLTGIIQFANADNLVVDARGRVGATLDVTPLGWDEAGLTGAILYVASRGDLPLAPAEAIISYGELDARTSFGSTLVEPGDSVNLTVMRADASSLIPVNGRAPLAVELRDIGGRIVASKNVTFATGNVTLALTNATFVCDNVTGPCRMTEAHLLLNQTANATRYVQGYRFTTQNTTVTVPLDSTMRQGNREEVLSPALASLRPGNFTMSVAALNRDGSVLAQTSARVLIRS